VDKQDRLGTIVSSLPNRPLRKRETEALEAHERLQMVIPDAYVYDQEFGEEIIHGAVFIGWDWVTTLVYDAETGWSAAITVSSDVGWIDTLADSSTQ
jgi:hypothetical protein